MSAEQRPPASATPGGLRRSRAATDPRGSWERVFCEWVDGTLDTPEPATPIWEDDGDRELGRELESYARVVSLLRAMPAAPAPEAVLTGVRERLRARARIRALAARRDVTQRMPWEALFNVVLLVALAAAWAVGVPRSAPQPRPTEATLFELAGTPLEVASSVLATYGQVEVVAGSQSLTGLTFRVSIRRDQLARLRDELALYPSLALQRTVLPDTEPTHVQVRVRATVAAVGRHPGW